MVVNTFRGDSHPRKRFATANGISSFIQKNVYLMLSRENEEISYLDIRF